MIRGGKKCSSLLWKKRENEIKREIRYERERDKVGDSKTKCQKEPTKID